MRLVASVAVVVFAVSSGSSAAAWETVRAEWVALDCGSSDLLRALYPNADAPALVLKEGESYQRLNRRALAMRSVSCVVFRSDKISLTSRMFLERFIAQGTPTFDLAVKSPSATEGRAILNKSKQGSSVEFEDQGEDAYTSAEILLDN